LQLGCIGCLFIGSLFFGSHGFPCGTRLSREDGSLDGLSTILDILFVLLLDTCKVVLHEQVASSGVALRFIFIAKARSNVGEALAVHSLHKFDDVIRDVAEAFLTLVQEETWAIDGVDGRFNKGGFFGTIGDSFGHNTIDSFLDGLWVGSVSPFIENVFKDGLVVLHKVSSQVVYDIGFGVMVQNRLMHGHEGAGGGFVGDGVKLVQIVTGPKGSQLTEKVGGVAATISSDDRGTTRCNVDNASSRHVGFLGTRRRLEG
jgi:hypothetical protein